MSLFLNGTEFNDIIFNSVNTTGMFNGTTVWGSSPVYTLTLQNDGHGTLTADKITGKAGDTVILSPTYNTYYRFSGYNITGGSVVGNTFTFGNSDATAKANFKVNAFTASGKMQDIKVLGHTYGHTAQYSSYPIISYRSPACPTSWSASRNGINAWSPASNVSGYWLSARGNVNFSASYKNNTNFDYWHYINNRIKTSGSKTTNTKVSIATTFTSRNIGIYNFRVWSGNSYFSGISAAGNTWSATGYAP